MKHFSIPVGSLGWILDAKFTVIKCVFAGPLSLFSLDLTCKVKDLAIQLKNTSKMPMSWGAIASEVDLAKMPKSLGGKLAIPNKLAKLCGRTSGKIRLSKAITCLWIRPEAVCNKAKRSLMKLYWEAKCDRPTPDPLKAKTKDIISKQYVSEVDGSGTPGSIPAEHKWTSQSSLRRAASFLMAVTICEQTCFWRWVNFDLLNRMPTTCSFK